MRYHSGLSDTCPVDVTIGCNAGSSCITQNQCPPFTDTSISDVWKYVCIGGKWESLSCVQLPPENFKYPVSLIEAALNYPISSITPTVDCYNCKFIINNNQSLPAGLNFDGKTGTISGIPTQIGETNVVVSARAEEAASEATVTLTFRVLNACPVENEWPVTIIGKKAESPCSEDTSKMQFRKCLVGGIWDEVDSENCKNNNITLVIILIIVVIVAFIFLLGFICCSKKSNRIKMKVTK